VIIENRDFGWRTRCRAASVEPTLQALGAVAERGERADRVDQITVVGIAAI
jgi:hypothetical protein